MYFKTKTAFAKIEKLLCSSLQSLGEFDMFLAFYNTGITPVLQKADKCQITHYVMSLRLS